MTKSEPLSSKSSLLALALIALACVSAHAEEKNLWEIGKYDRTNNEFALAPKGWYHYRKDGFFVVGRSDPKRDWPYAHPGPADNWAGNQPHSFFIIFALKETVSEGSCRLIFNVLDSHARLNPKVRLDINGHNFSQTLAKGSGKGLSGELAQVKPSRFVIEFPAALLKTGTNQIEIVNTSGSWFLYDSVAFKTPDGVTLGSVSDCTVISSVSAAPALIERGGKLFQRVNASVTHIAGLVEAAVKLDQTELKRVQLNTGRQTIELLLPAVQNARLANLSLAGPNGTLAEQPMVLTPGVREIIVVFKTHFDIGFTDMASNIVQRYRTSMIDNALDVADKSRSMPSQQRFAWTLAGWPLRKILEDWPGQTADRKQRVEKALKEGRFTVHALPFTTHTELLEAEDLVRGLGYSSQLARRLEIDLPRDAKMTDVPEHTWMMATLLKQAGIDFMMIGCNGSSGTPQVPPLFWWEGPDGSRVLTMYSPQYGTSVTPFKNWPYKTWLACIHTGDNHGPPTAEEVKAVFDQAAKEFPGVKVRTGRMSDFCDAILAEKADLPIVRGDTPDTWIHGPMSDPNGARLARNLRPLIAATESLNTQIRLLGISIPDAAPAVSAAYEQSLLYGEHTWGGSLGWIKNTLSYGESFRKERAAGHFKHLEESWDEHTAYIEKARDIIAPVLNKNLQALAQGVNAEGKRIVVYNPLPWKRSGLVSLAADGEMPGALKSADDGEIALVQTNGNRLCFIAPEVPAMGYRTFIPAPGHSTATRRVPPSNGNATIETAFFRAIINSSRGTILSLTDKRSGRELVDRTSPVRLGQYLYERFDGNQVTQYCKAYLKPGRMPVDFFKPGLPLADERPHQAASPTNFILRIEETPVSVSAVLEAKAANNLPAITTRFTLYASQPCADLEITLHDKPLESWPEAGWLCLPFNINKPQFHLGRLGSIINPACDIIPGANRHILALNTGLTITDPQGCGVGLCPIDHPLVSLDTPGCWKFSTHFVPKKPVAYVNLFNNQWDTNFRLWNQGSWSSRVRIWAVDRYDAESSLITPSLEARYPLQAAIANSPPGKLPLSGKGLEVSRKGILVTALGTNPDGAGTAQRLWDGAGAVLRLWEYAGKSGPVKVRMPEGTRAETVRPVDLRGRASSQPVAIENGVFEIDVAAFTPVSVVFDPSK